MDTMSRTNSAQVQEAHKCEQSTTLAQLELFIRLGNMSDLDPNKHFAAILDLGNALITGDLGSIQRALSFYTTQTQLLFEHVEYLRRAFAHAGVTFQEPAVLKYDGTLGQAKTMVVISIMLERAGKVAFISSDAALPSYVHSFTRNKAGIMTMEPAREDPHLLLKQISRVVRLPDVIAPPPGSSAASGMQ